MNRYSIYKGLQKPLVYRGFKGKFIGWGIGFLIMGLVGGGLLGALWPQPQLLADLGMAPQLPQKRSPPPEQLWRPDWSCYL